MISLFLGKPAPPCHTYPGRKSKIIFELPIQKGLGSLKNLDTFKGLLYIFTSNTLFCILKRQRENLKIKNAWKQNIEKMKT